MMRKPTKQVMVGGVAVGGTAQISVQSMLNAPAHAISANVEQAKLLEVAGCQIIRIALPDMEALPLITALKESVSMPVVADIHFDYRLALAAVDAGVDKIRINPGNIGDADRVRQVAKACNAKNIPIRIGVNSGSVEKNILARHGGPTAEALLESAAYHASLLEKEDFNNIIISLKASNLYTMLNAYRLASDAFEYPLHLGVTEAGTERMGLIKSAIGIGGLLAEGIGDTIRVSLTAEPAAEIKAAFDILKAVGLKGSGAQIISCPTCGRTKIDVISMAAQVEERLKDFPRDIKVAVMGCAVNGPGEAREADIGIAGGDGCGVIFYKGEIIGNFPEDRLVDELINMIEREQV